MAIGGDNYGCYCCYYYLFIFITTITTTAWIVRESDHDYCKLVNIVVIIIIVIIIIIIIIIIVTSLFDTIAHDFFVVDEGILKEGLVIVVVAAVELLIANIYIYISTKIIIKTTKR